MENQILNKLKGYFEQNYTKLNWPDSLLENIEIQRLTGLTNKNFHITHKGENHSENKKIGLVYKHFNETDLVELIDRDVDNRVCCELDKFDLGPTVIQFDSKSRLEIFLEGQVFTTEDMLNPNLQKK